MSAKDQAAWEAERDAFMAYADAMNDRAAGFGLRHGGTIRDWQEVIQQLWDKGYRSAATTPQSVVDAVWCDVLLLNS